MIRDTSREGLRSVLPSIGSRQLRVLADLVEHGPATNTELSNRLDSPINTITPRTNELVAKGLAREKERRSCTITGRKAIVWEATESAPNQILEV